MSATGVGTVRLEIEGMSCEHCVEWVERALKGTPGVVVRSVAIGSAVVEDGAEAPHRAVEALAAVGFTARIAPAAPGPRRGGCCGGSHTCG